MTQRQREIIVLAALDIMGLKWLGRDSNGYICSYTDKPEKKISTFRGITDHTWWRQENTTECDCEGFLEKYFREIKAEDPEPTQIETLLSRKLSEEFGDSFSKGNGIEDIFKR